MFAVLFASSLAALLLVYICIPAVWCAIMADDALDAHEAGLMVVASRNPFRETGPPANMAKLILLRHKIQTSNRKRRSSSHSRQASRNCMAVPSQRTKNPWVRLGKPFAGKQSH
ncbi:hypothetical protein BKA70DRAFT_1557504 [Coprinopsis sp. MPI-PUGE-AT-0042]|nr:hypothetical protein BKA70DRAFT_1557504 [Coprinopsis sp. MPI-PUGE-AT-0042]